MDAVALLRETDIRRAFRYALDLDELVTKIARGAAISGSPGVLPPDHVMYRKPEMEYRYDPVKAIALLNSRGFTRLNRQGVRTGTDGNSLTFNLLCSSREVRMAEIIRQRLGEAGIHINIVSVDGKTRDAKIIGNNFQLAITGHGGWGADPDYLRERFSVKNDKSLSPSVSGRSGYVNPELNRLLEQQRMEMDTMKRMTLIGRVQELLAEELPEIPLFNTTSQTVFRPTVYNGWKFMFDHHAMVHSKLSYLDTDWKHTEHGQTDKHIADY